MINTSIDVMELGTAGTIFLGVGAGVAKHKTKYHITATDPRGRNINQTYSTKISCNFAYTVGAGVAFPIFDGVNAELAYSWRDFGSTRPMRNTDGDYITRKTSYRSHNLSVGLRIDVQRLAALGKSYYFEMRAVRRGIDIIAR